MWAKVNALLVSLRELQFQRGGTAPAVLCGADIDIVPEPFATQDKLREWDAVYT